jgi:uncharacterized protein
MNFLDSSKVMLSPCIGICALDADGYCQGCRRTGDEIAHWMYYSDGERLHLMNDVLPQRTPLATDP